MLLILITLEHYAKTAITNDTEDLTIENQKEKRNGMMNGGKHGRSKSICVLPCKWKKQRNEIVGNDLRKSIKSGG
jgi:hypothetical protein